MTAQPNLSLKKSLKELSRTTSSDPVQPRYEYHFKKQVAPDRFEAFLKALHDGVLKAECDKHGPFFEQTNASQTRTFYSVDGQRLTSFSITPADCTGLRR